MKEWISCTCERGESWQIFKEKDIENDVDMRCLKGHEAVMAMVRDCADQIIVSVIPRATVDPVNKKTIINQNKYHLHIESTVSGWERISTEPYTKEEIIKLANFFIGMETNSAMKFWKLKKLGENNNCRIDT